MKKIEQTVYVAKDGKKFFDLVDCTKYEETLSKIKYFVVYHTPDLNETGSFTKVSVVAVYSSRVDHRAIVEKWCVDEMHFPILGPSVQGCGFQRHFEIDEDKGDCRRCEKLWNEYSCGNRIGDHVWPWYDHKVFLSTIPMEGFPDPFDYMAKWFPEN